MSDPDFILFGLEAIAINHIVRFEFFKNNQVNSNGEKLYCCIYLSDGYYLNLKKCDYDRLQRQIDKVV